MADTREVYDQLGARAEDRQDADRRLGASAAVARCCARWREGVPWAAVETVGPGPTSTGALAPQNLTKSGAIFQFLGSVPADGSIRP